MVTSTGSTLQEDGEHHAHDDHLYPAVVTDAGDGALYLVDGAGIPEEVQNHKGAKDHEHDLQALLDALPEEGVVHGHILLKGRAGYIEVGKSRHQRPYKGHRGHFFGGLAESEDAHQHHDDGAECHNKVEKFHDCLSLSVLMGGSPSVLAGHSRRETSINKEAPPDGRGLELLQ